MLTTSEIATFIANDQASMKKTLAKMGERYYEGDHDIKGYRIFFFDSDGVLKEDKTKSNIKISHPLFAEIVDQLVAYMLPDGLTFIKSDDPKLQEQLDSYFDEDFVAELSEVLTGTQSKGFDYMFAHKNEEGYTRFQAADSIGVVECEAKYTSDHKDHVLFWYIDRLDKDGNRVINIRDYDSETVSYYTRIEDGEIKPDKSNGGSQQPHEEYTIGKKSYGESYGFVPFFRLDNCKKQFSALKPIKALIDDYDLMNAGLSNNIQDTNEALYVVKGFQGDNLDELMTNIKAKKHIGVDDDGGVEVHTVDIPTEARKTKMEIDEKNIYRFGFALNTAGLKDTNATTNLAIQSAYSLLSLRATKMLKRLKQFLRKLIKVVLDEINAENGTAYAQKDVYFEFEWEVPTNAQENAQIELIEAQRKQTEINTVLNLAGRIDDETMLQLICEQLDIDYQDIKNKVPKPEEDPVEAAKKILDNVPPEGDVV